MKRCPTCDRTFDDALRFCQADGTSLIDDAPAVDPYKTMVARPEDLGSPSEKAASEAPIPPPARAGQVLEIPPKIDPNKTMMASEDEIRREMAARDAEREQVIEIPPISENRAPEQPKIEETAASARTPDQPAPSSGFGLPADPSPFSQTTASIPSPFDRPQKPAEPKPEVPRWEPETIQQPFNPFDAPQGVNIAPQQWTPPPAPDPGWQNTPVGQGTPFEPPVSYASLNQTTAVVSLVLGIISILLCQITGPVAIVLGLVAKRKIAADPDHYGGSGLATAGIITGAIGSVLLVLVLLYLLIVFGLVAGEVFR